MVSADISEYWYCPEINQQLKIEIYVHKWAEYPVFGRPLFQ